MEILEWIDGELKAGEEGIEIPDCENLEELLEKKNDDTDTIR